MNQTTLHDEKMYSYKGDRFRAAVTERVFLSCFCEIVFSMQKISAESVETNIPVD